MSDKAGATTVARIRYAAVVGKPIPKIIATTIVINKAKNGMPTDHVKINPDILEPKPVMPKVPAIIPAAAQAMAIGTMFFVPLIMAKLRFWKKVNDILLVHNIFKTRRIMIEKKQALKGEYPFNIMPINKKNGIINCKPFINTFKVLSPSSWYFFGFKPFFLAWKWTTKNV